MAPIDRFNSGNMFIKPQSDSASTIIIKPFYFIQIAPLNKAHFLVKINNDRGGTATYVGEANWEPDADIPESLDKNGFISAHETGHAGGLYDDYVEDALFCSYDFPGFVCNTPGDPFSVVPNTDAMMHHNRNIELRYFWHNAEFIRKATNIPMLVEGTAGNNGIRKYYLRNHDKAPNRNFTQLPLFIESNASGTPRGKFDLYLYQLGDDDYPHIFKAGGIF